MLHYCIGSGWHDSAGHDVVMQEKTRLLKDRQLAHWADWHTPDRPPLHDLVQRTCSQWLLARCQRLGIAIEEATLSVEGCEQHRGKNGELRFSTVDFSGSLRVADADALRTALVGGVG